MLTGCLFENKVEVKILGDTSDLISLHKTVRKITLVIVDYELEDTNVSNLLVDFLENIEKAYTGMAISEEKTIHRNQATYYGFQSSRGELMMISHLLRLLSDYVVTDELDEINMRLLEYIIAETISSVNKQEYVAISNYIDKEFLHVSIKQFIKGFHAMVNNKIIYEKH